MHRSISILLLFTGIILFSGCKKEYPEVVLPEVVEPDYRDQFIGEYEISYSYYAADMSGFVFSDIDTTYIGTIGKGGPGELTIENYNGYIGTLTVDESGDILASCGTQIGSFTSIGFSIYYTDDLCGPGPLGMNSQTIYHGIKQ